MTVAFDPVSYVAQNLEEAGLALFADWLGVARSGDLRSRLAPYRDKLARIARLQTQVPGPDLRRSGDAFLRPASDELKRSLARDLSLVPKPFWPDGRPYALAVTHDIDRVFASFHRLKWSRDLAGVARDMATMLDRRRWPSNPFYNFNRLLALTEELDIKVALYVLQEKRRWLKSLFSGELQHVIGVYQLAQVADALREFSARGHEIGIHASFDGYNSALVLGHEIDAVENLGVPRPVGVRNHYLNFDETTVDSELANGVLYDSTMGFNFQSGFRCGTCFPYAMQGITELPFQLMDSALWYELPGQEEREGMCRAIEYAVRDAGGALVLNFHLHYLNQEAFPDRVALLRAIIDRAKREGAWIATPAQIAQRWHERTRGA
jgi:peptidoglycan/xylan/chitin deacetylase (PgdA/CDA1 family)